METESQGRNSLVPRGRGGSEEEVQVALAWCWPTKENGGFGRGEARRLARTEGPLSSTSIFPGRERVDA